ncbi:S-layer homology domain-containing protein [Paenibacillus silvae]|uniref:S-layer homology domain-containing protein n=1 Tax=Paenibacillus silvae TaxID=1325358 RepID=UPI0020054A6A|nr:S-layer homology domain-containing protein [Paenibacillus silvae]MCK6077999.1 S-layer homology domain-containing protein [Paenibacillus silvae]MCK6152198.1 S-layer homology domain-containing protein [Paenibacillus silvae]MCK6270882.1 S-layer homology domain-containing protein [Paenibacillus silvae]
MHIIKRTAQIALVALLLTHTLPVSAQAQSQNSTESSVLTMSAAKEDAVNTSSRDQMKKAMERGLIQGSPDGNLRIDDDITRQEIATVLVKALDLRNESKQTQPFTDVKANSWSAHAIETVKKAGLLQGDQTGRFHPQAKITGQELVAVLARAIAPDPLTNLKESLPADWKEASSWATPYIQKALEANLLSEYTGKNKVKQGLSRGEAVGMIMSAIFPETRLSVVQSIQGNQTRINGRTYRISEQVAGLLNERNKDVLEQAGIQFKSQNDTINEISILEIRSGGEEAETGKAEFSNNLILDGNKATLQGDLRVKADFISIQKLRIKGKLVILPELEHDFYAKDVKASIVSVQGGDSNTVAFENSDLTSMNVSKQDVHVLLSGTTTAREVNVQSNSIIDIDKTVNLPLLNIVEGASNVKLNGTLDTVKLDTSQPTQLNGIVDLKQLTVDGAGTLNLNITGSIQQLSVNNTAAKVNLMGSVQIAQFSLAPGVSSSAVSSNTGSAVSAPASASTGGSSGIGSTGTTANRAPELLKPFENRKFTANGQGITLNLNHYVTDPDGDDLTYTVVSSAPSIAKVTVKGVDLEIVPLAHGTATVTVSSNDGRGKRLRSTFEVHVNASPFASPIPDQELRVGGGSKDIDLMIYFMDDEKYESELVYSVKNSSSDIMDTDIVSSGVGKSVLRILPKQTGQGILTINVDDGQLADDGSTGVTEVTMKVVVLPSLNRTPIGEGPVRIDTYFGDDIPLIKLNEQYTDPDGDPLLFTAQSSDLSGITVEEKEGQIKLTARRLGTYTISYTVNDGRGGVINGSFDVYVQLRPNRNPEGELPGWLIDYQNILGNPIPLITLNKYYSDPDGDSLTFSAESSDSDGLKVENNEGVLSLTALKVGEYTINITIEDGKGGKITTAYHLKVNPKPNERPVLIKNFPVQKLFLGKGDTVIDLSTYFNDPDGDVLTYTTLLDLNNYFTASVQVQGDKLVIQPKHTGSFQVEIKAKDTDGESVNASMDIEILEAGEITSISDQTITWPWSVFNFDLSPYLINFDMASTTVTASSSDNLIATVSANGMQLSVVPVAEGNTTVTLTVTDQKGRSEQTTFDVIVKGQEIIQNLAPEVVASIYEQVLTPGVTNDRSFDLSQLFSDSDGDTLQFTIKDSSNKAVNASINGNLLTLKPGTEDAVAPLTIIANDGKGETAEYSFNVRTASLVNDGIVNVNTKSGVKEALIYSTVSVFPNQSSFKMYSGTPDSTFTGPDTINTNQITLSVSPLLYWIIGDDGRAVVLKVNSLPQGSPELFFSQYADAGDGRSIVQLYYTGDGNASNKATGYQVDVYQWMKQTSTMKVTTNNVLDVTPGMPYIYINYTFYDFFDVTSASYYNDEIQLYNPTEYSIVALVLKKDGRIVDMLGDPTSHDQFLSNGGTIIRKRGIFTGSQQFSVTGEWNEFPKGTLQYVGRHTP